MRCCRARRIARYGSCAPSTRSSSSGLASDIDSSKRSCSISLGVERQRRPPRHQAGAARDLRRDERIAVAIAADPRAEPDRRGVERQAACRWTGAACDRASGSTAAARPTASPRTPPAPTADLVERRRPLAPDFLGLPGGGDLAPHRRRCSVSRSRQVTSGWSSVGQRLGDAAVLVLQRPPHDLGRMRRHDELDPQAAHRAACSASGGDAGTTAAAAALPRSRPAAAARADRAGRRGAGARGGAARRRSRGSGSGRSCARSAAPPRPASRAARRPAPRASRPRRRRAARALGQRAHALDPLEQRAAPPGGAAFRPSSSPSSRTSSRSGRCGSTCGSSARARTTSLPGRRCSRNAIIAARFNHARQSRSERRRRGRRPPHRLADSQHHLRHGHRARRAVRRAALRDRPHQRRVLAVEAEGIGAGRGRRCSGCSKS